jgi:hypothetical protein
MPYPKVLVFIEGHMERMFLNNTFPYAEAISVSNGIAWTVPALCKQIATRFRARNFYGDAVVAWVDREKRNETAGEIRQALLNALIDAGSPPETTHIPINDRMSETLYCPTSP